METSTTNSIIQGAGGLLGGLTGGIFGMIEGKKNREFQKQMQAKQIKAAKESQMLQARLNELAAGRADERTRELYKDFESPEAKRRMLEEAGLSVGLMYGQGNMASGHVGGGAQAEGTGMASPSGAGANPYNASGWVNAGVGAGLAMAQARLMESEANKNNADADRLRGEGPRGEAELANINAVINNILADTKNKGAEYELKQAQKRFTNAEAALAELRTETDKKAQADILRNYALQNERAWQEILQTKWQNYITGNTAKEIIESFKLQNQQTIQEIAKIKGEIDLNENQCKLITEMIAKTQYEATESKWRGYNEQTLMERFYSELHQSAEFKDADIDQSQWETIIKGIFSIAGFGVLRSGELFKKERPKIGY